MSNLFARMWRRIVGRCVSCGDPAVLPTRDVCQPCSLKQIRFTSESSK